MKTPELEGPKFNLLKLADLKANCEAMLGFTPEKRKIRAAYEEVIKALEERGHELPYICGHCNSPIDGEMEKCWACGVVLDDEEDPTVQSDEVEARARKLGIDPDGKDREELTAEVEAAEKAKRAKTRDANLFCIEADRINEKLGELLPDGWRVKRSGQYNSYYDGNGNRRIAVFHRGLNVHFSVEDGVLDGVKHLEFLDAEERKRRHAGRTNYMFTGEISKDALEICATVMKRYDGE